MTVGSAVGSIRDLFTKVKAIDAKHGKFDLILCTGDFFGPANTSDDVSSVEDDTSKLLAGELEGVCSQISRIRVAESALTAPIECYIMQGENPLPEKVIEKFAKTGGELCKNVFLMSASWLSPSFEKEMH